MEDDDMRRVLAVVALFWAGCARAMLADPAADPSGHPVVDAGPDGDGATDAGPNVAVVLSTYVNGSKQNATWVAAQSGDGAWQKLVGDAGMYRFDAAPGGFGFAIVCASSPTHFVRGQLLHATTAELTQLRADCTLPDATPRTLSGRVNGLQTGDSATVTLGASDQMTQTTYSLTAPAGTYDLLAQKHLHGDGAAAQLVLVRRVMLDMNRTLDLDFGAAASVMPALANVTLVGAVASETPAVAVRFISSGGTTDYLADTSGASARQPFVPMTMQEDGDVHVVEARAEDTVNQYARVSQRYVKAPGDVVLALPSSLGAASVFPSMSVPYLALTASWGTYPGAAAYVAGYALNVTGETKAWDVRATAGWMASRPNPAHAFPAFSGLAEWQDGWAYAYGQTVAWHLAVVTSNQPIPSVLAALGGAAGADGLELRSAIARGTVSP
jgi:hypothetical protein